MKRQYTHCRSREVVTNGENLCPVPDLWWAVVMIGDTDFVVIIIYPRVWCVEASRVTVLLTSVQVKEGKGEGIERGGETPLKLSPAAREGITSPLGVSFLRALECTHTHESVRNITYTAAAAVHHYTICNYDYYYYYRYYCCYYYLLLQIHFLALTKYTIPNLKTTTLSIHLHFSGVSVFFFFCHSMPLI